MRQMKNLSGEKFGKLTILEYSHKTKSAIYWKCKCECGNEKIIRGTNMTHNLTNSCGCESHPKRNKAPGWNGIGEISGDFLTRLKHSAQRRNIIIDISKKYLWDLFLKQERKCALSGYNLSFQTIDNLRDGTASLDRIDNTKGYIEGNVQWVHKDVNRIKWIFSNIEFLQIIKDIYQHINQS